MFKKIISNLSFSPALVGQLSFYTKRLRKEEISRRLGLVFLAMALVVQSFTVFQPPESANASSSTDMVTGGIGKSLDNFLTPYDLNAKHLRDVMNYVGITRNEIVATKYTSWKAGEKLSWGFASRFSYEQGEKEHSITDSNNQIVTTAYSRPLKLWDNSNTTIYGWSGYSIKIGWFAIMESCGNLVTNTVPSPPPPQKCLLNSNILADNDDCKPCPGNTTLWIDNPSCIPNIIKSKTAINTSQGFVDASSITARTNDQISYTISIENTSLSPLTIKLEEQLEDVLEYSNIIDKGGGTLNKTTMILSWPDITLQPNDKQTRTFVIRIFDTIPSTANGSNDKTSYDCVMANVFGNSVKINIECPTLKIIEQVASELPKTGSTENIIFAGVILSISVYFYARTKQIKKEVYIIRRNTNAGSI